MKVKVTYEEKVRFRAEARGHEVLCDQPAANKGDDTGMSPPEFLLVSLGTCAGYYAVEYLKTRNLPTTGLTVDVEAAKAAAPARLGEFHITVHTPDLEPRHRDGILRAVKACLVHNTLTHPPQIAIEFDSPVAA